MLCEKCNEREAMVTLTLVTNGVTKTHHFCHECANQFRLEEVSENSELSKTIFRILSQTMGKPEAGKLPEKEKEEADLVCPVCGKTLKEYREDGFFGCAACVKAFYAALSGTILSLQGTDTYNGSRPEKIRRKKTSSRDEKEKAEQEKLLTDLKNQLDSAVLLEDYGRASELRDRIREITKGAEVHE